MVGQLHSANIAITGNDEIVVLVGGTRIERFRLDGEPVAVWTIPPKVPGTPSTGSDIEVDGEGHVYVSDRVSNRFLEFDGMGALLGEWGPPSDLAYQCGGLESGFAVTPDGLVYANLRWSILKYWYSGTMVRASDQSLELFVDDERYLGSMVFRWDPGSVHEISTTPVQYPAAGTRFDFAGWSNGGGLSQTVVIPETPPTFTAQFDKSYWLDVPIEHGTVELASSWQPEGSVLDLHPTPEEHYDLSEWLGEGAGSYTGRHHVATVRMDGPIVQRPVFKKHGFDFTISASDTDPFATSAAPSGGVRNLYLWVTCADRGIAAFEADVAGSLTPLAFVPQPNVLNVYGADRLMLAVGGCPTGTEVNHLLGHWVVDDHGGDLRLVPSAASGAITAVDCHMIETEGWVDPRVFCFSSAGTPAILGTNGCVESGAPTQITNLRAVSGMRRVIVTWETIGDEPDGFHVERRDGGAGSFVRLTSEALRSDPPSRYEDADVEQEHAYDYRVIVVDDGVEVAFGPVSVATGRWPQFQTKLEPIGPNPAVGRASISFSLASPGHTKLAIYDVTGRLVQTIANGTRATIKGCVKG